MGAEGPWGHRARPERGAGATPRGSLRRPSSGPSLLPQSRTYLGMSTLRDLIFKRPSRQFQYLHVLLDLSSHEKDKVTRPVCPAARSPPAVPGSSPASAALPEAALLAAAVGGRLFFHVRRHEAA